MPDRYFVEGSDVYVQKFVDEAQLLAQLHTEGDAHRVADTLNDYHRRLHQALEACPEGERGDEKGQDYGPSARASEVVDTTPAPRVAELKPDHWQVATKEDRLFESVDGLFTAELSLSVEVPMMGRAILKRTAQNMYYPTFVDIDIESGSLLATDARRLGAMLIELADLADKEDRAATRATADSEANHDAGEPKATDKPGLPNPPAAQPDSSYHFKDEIEGEWGDTDDTELVGKLKDELTQPDEKVCGTCGGEKVTETFVCGEGSAFYDPCPDCQPVPPSEGEDDPLPKPPPRFYVEETSDYGPFGGKVCDRKDGRCWPISSMPQPLADLMNEIATPENERDDEPTLPSEDDTAAKAARLIRHLITEPSVAKSSEKMQPSEGEVAAGRFKLEFRPDAEYKYRIIDTTDGVSVLIFGGGQAEWLHKTLNDLAATNPTPEGHVAVYLPVADVDRWASVMYAPEELDRRVAEACRQALSNGEGA